MVGKWHLLLLAITLTSVVSATDSSSIKPYTEAKLVDPTDQGQGTCKASAKGSLKDLGPVDTACQVSWSDDKKKVKGSYNDTTPFFSVTGSWSSCQSKATHSETITFAGKEVSTKVKVNKCGQVTITVDVPADLKCEKDGSKWVCKAQLDGVKCDGKKTDAETPGSEGNQGSSIPPPSKSPPKQDSPGQNGSEGYGSGGGNGSKNSPEPKTPSSEKTPGKGDNDKDEEDDGDDGGSDDDDHGEDSKDCEDGQGDDDKLPGVGTDGGSGGSDGKPNYGNQSDEGKKKSDSENQPGGQGSQEGGKHDEHSEKEKTSTSPNTDGSKQNTGTTVTFNKPSKGTPTIIQTITPPGTNSTKEPCDEHGNPLPKNKPAEKSGEQPKEESSEQPKEKSDEQQPKEKSKDQPKDKTQNKPMDEGAKKTDSSSQPQDKGKTTPDEQIKTTQQCVKGNGKDCIEQKKETPKDGGEGNKYNYGDDNYGNQGDNYGNQKRSFGSLHKRFQKIRL